MLRRNRHARAVKGFWSVAPVVGCRHKSRRARSRKGLAESSCLLWSKIAPPWTAERYELGNPIPSRGDLAFERDANPFGDFRCDLLPDKISERNFLQLHELGPDCTA